MLNDILEGRVRVTGKGESAGRERLEGVLIEPDGERTIYIYEGQLKEIPEPLEVGKTYRAFFRPFVNNRWLDLKLVAVKPADDEP